MHLPVIGMLASIADWPNERFGWALRDARDGAELVMCTSALAED